ncbi:MAG: F0F1 ATP synthase subunit A [Phototrophicaceae bacterium]
MNATTRGALIFVGIIVFVAVLCYLVPFVIFGANGSIAALPVIEVPGEVLTSNGFPFIFFGWAELTNTWVATIIADILVIVFALLAWNASKGWTNEVPGKFQAWVETIIDGLYGITKQMAGDTPKVRNVLFPLVGTLFIFLLTANWMSLMPGIDSVGEMHCAHGSQAGYMKRGSQLYNTTPLNAGISVTHEQEEVCEEIKKGYYPESFVAFDPDGDGKPSYDEAQEAEIDALAAEINSGDFAEEELALLVEEYEEATGYPEVIYFPSAAELESGVKPYSFVVTPFVRPAATDLNLTLGLSIVAFFFIQYFGLSTLGPGYLQKFINLNALGNISKNPIGGVDFVVGIFEIVSEFAKVISLAFRLFGNIFAGAVLIFVMHFLIATGLPIIFFGLETIVGFAQAAVFAVLTLIFCAQAMVSHHHDDDHEEAHH